MCSLAYFCAATGNAGLCVAAVVAAALGHVKDLPSYWGAEFGSLQLLLPQSHGVTVVSGEHLGDGHAGHRTRSAQRNRFFLRLLFRVELCGSNGNDVGVFEYARS